MPVAPRRIPIYDSVTQMERHADGGLFSCGEFEQAIRELPVRGRPHRHNHPELFWFESGDGVVTNDMREYRIQAPAFVFIDTGHVHAWPENENLQGLRLSFSAAFARCPSTGATNLFPHPQPVVIPVPSRHVPGVSELATRIRREWKTRPDDEYLCALRELLALMLVEARRAHRITQTEPAMETAATRLHRAFCDLLETRLDAAFGAGEAASALGVTADHLSAVTRERTGRSASFLIRARLMLEARRLLAHSSLGIAEIAHRLGYADPSYFGKVFTADEGCTPGEYRKRHDGPAS